MLAVPPPYIRELARDVRDLRVGSSPSSNREVLADWCESEGYRRSAQVLRPRPLGEDEGKWLWSRKATLQWLTGEAPSMLNPPEAYDL